MYIQIYIHTYIHTYKHVRIIGIVNIVGVQLRENNTYSTYIQYHTLKVLLAWWISSVYRENNTYIT